MEAFLQMYWSSFVVIFMVLVVLIILWRKGKRDEVKLAIYWFVSEAEKYLGSKAGKAKKGMVIEAVYSRLPVVFRLVFTKNEIDEFIEASVKELKDYLDKGYNLDADIQVYESQAE